MIVRAPLLFGLVARRLVSRGPPSLKMGGQWSSSSASFPKALVVTLEIEESRVPKFLEVMQTDAEGTRKEDGNIRFDVLRDSEQANKFVLYEVYKDDAAVEAHRAQPHYQLWQDFKKEGGVLSQAVLKMDGIGLTPDSEETK
mmetsp:Transcript_423/g.1193  ORF Transcript_423/g.1193 Transcript_423/m.1193 type:complete len:142 (-) Transcript_423:202-627(-)